MPKYARKHQLSDSLVYHVLNRGNGRSTIFHDSLDYEYFLSLLGKYKKRFNVKLYHWVIMPNHYHLLLEIENPMIISKLLAGLTVTYTRYHHKRHHSCGFLWQGRFKLQAVQKEQYLIACGRYIERNPVRSELVVSAEEYAYSSSRFYCLGLNDGLTDESPEYCDFGADKAQQQFAYLKFLQDFVQEDDNLWTDMDKARGSEEFLNKLIKVNGRIMPRKADRIAK
jgi:putative transposase